MNPYEGYRITSGFGMRWHPVQDKPKFHRGIDLVIHPENRNGPIYAFVAGEVTHAKFGVSGSGIPSEMGIVVAIKVKDGCLHVYAHLSAVVVKVGQRVGRGEMIGRQGTTGVDAKGNPSSTGLHLHFEVRKNSSPSYGWTPTEAGVVEPTQYLIDYYMNEQEELDEMKALEAVAALEKVVETQAKRIEKLEEKVEAPAWFIKEFGSADLGGLINDPKMPDQGWRYVAVTLRAVGWKPKK